MFRTLDFSTDYRLIIKESKYRKTYSIQNTDDANTILLGDTVYDIGQGNYIELLPKSTITFEKPYDNVMNRLYGYCALTATAKIYESYEGDH